MEEEAKSSITNDQMTMDLRARRSQFWFIVSFSLFLIVTFIYFLPLRFRYESLIAEIKEGGAMEEGHGEAMPGEDRGHEESTLSHEEGEVREGLAVNLNLSPVPFETRTATRFDFLVNEKPANVPVPLTELKLNHGKFMHVVGIRDDLNEFFHIHPEPTSTPGLLQTEYAFQKPGLYKIWSEIRRGDTDYIFGHPKIFMSGPGEISNKQISFGRNVIVDSYQVSLNLPEPVRKGEEAHPTFDVHTLAGREVELEDYLEAQMHLSIISEDLTQFIHTHPEGGAHMSSNEFAKKLLAHAGEETAGAAEDETVDFHVVFPKTGLYKIFAQFRPKNTSLFKNEALTAGFWIRVEEESVSTVPAKLYYIVISIVLIVILSWLVGRYVRRREDTL